MLDEQQNEKKEQFCLKSPDTHNSHQSTIHKRNSGIFMPTACLCQFIRAPSQSPNRFETKEINANLYNANHLLMMYTRCKNECRKQNEK